MVGGNVFKSSQECQRKDLCLCHKDHHGADAVPVCCAHLTAISSVQFEFSLADWLEKTKTVSYTATGEKTKLSYLQKMLV